MAQNSPAHKRLLMVGAPVPRLCDNHSIRAVFRQAGLAEVIEPAVDDAQVELLRLLRDARHAAIPGLAHARARLDADERPEVEGRVVGRRRVQEETGEDARTRPRLDERRLRRGHRLVDELQRRGGVGRARAVVQFVRARCEALASDVVDVGVGHSEGRDAWPEEHER